jgi:hypothetical protein
VRAGIHSRKNLGALSSFAANVDGFRRISTGRKEHEA